MGTRTNLREEQYVQFSFLSEGQKSLMYSEVLEVLQYTGANIHHEQAREMLRKKGCTVKGNRVFIPSQLVHEALHTVPPITTLHHWDNSGRLRIEQGRVYFGPGPTCPQFIDPYTLERRRYLRQDASLVARVCDALPEIGFVMSLGSISDVTDGLEEIYEFAEMIQNSSKPVIAWCFSREHCQDIHHIAAALAGGEEELYHRPIYIFYNEPISPLMCDFNAIEKLIYCAENGIPQIFAPANSGGATVPATHAAHLVITLAESLIGVVISQIIRPGSCIIIGGTQSILDMRTMVFSYGAPELSIMSAGLSELAEYIGLPVFTAGGCSDAKTTELQSAIEPNISLHSAVLSGANLVHDVGFLDSGMTGSIFQLVMADECISMARRIARGVLVTEETLAEEEIMKYGLSGDYSKTDHTKKWSRSHWRPRLMDRQSYDDWKSDGSKGMKQRIYELTMKIVKEHKGTQEKVPQQAREEIEGILQAAEERKAREKAK